MAWDNIRKAINILFPAIGIGLLIFYETCETSCSSLQGTFLGVDLKMVGILFMAAVLALIPLGKTRFSAPVDHLRTMLLAGALGGEVLLVRFQIVNDTYCSYCLAFGLCVLVLFAVNFRMKSKLLALGAFGAGVAAFWLFFRGSILPLYY